MSKSRSSPLNFGSALASASGTIPTDRGDITVSWERSGTNYTLTATLPANTTADIALPLGEASDPGRLRSTEPKPNTLTMEPTCGSNPSAPEPILWL